MSAPFRSPPESRATVIDTSALTSRERYQLLTSLVVPRPIGWLSTRAAGAANLAPFSYYMALSATPMLVGVSIGLRNDGPKDTLRNIRESGCFCVNVVADRFLDEMNASSGDHPYGIDEFQITGIAAAEADTVDAPYVAECPAVLECRLFREVDLGDAPNVLVIGEVLAVRLGPELRCEEGTLRVDPHALRAVGRLGGEWYARQGELVRRARPIVQ